MKKLSFATFFIAIFMLAAFSTQGGVVPFDIPAAVAGDDDSKSKSKSDDDDKSKSKSDEDDSDGTYSEWSEDEDSEHGDSTSGSSKVSVCHDGSTLSVGASSESAHLAHGDTSGACVVASCDCPPGIEACTCADGSDGNPSVASPTAAGPTHRRSY